MTHPDVFGPELAKPGEWITNARCRHGDVDVFFSDRAEHIAEAKAICARCPVRIPCRGWALLNREEYGVFGGLDAEERLEILGPKRRRRSA